MFCAEKKLVVSKTLTNAASSEEKERKWVFSEGKAGIINQSSVVGVWNGPQNLLQIF